MYTKSKEDEIFIGRNAGKDLLYDIKNAKSSIKIVSPYLSADYVKELIKLHKLGKVVTLITCDKILENKPYSDFNIKDLIREEQIFDSVLKLKRKKGMLAFEIIFLISLIFIPLSLWFNVFLFFFSTLFLVSLFGFFYFYLINPIKINYLPIFRIRVFDSTSGDKPWSTELVHSKIFIIDERVAYLGSVNFTYSGFVKHYETLIKIKDISAIRAISEEVERLYSFKDLRAKSVEEWAGLG
jgi:phosphatidylserine/phosphatidylglycerophosphate/cardiolipin synthase-like enzyme